LFGSRFERVQQAERRECAKTLALSSQIDAEYQRQTVLKAQAGLD
jgi:hypothetical protein